VAGADKLNLLCHMGENSDFLERFGIVLFYRDGIDVEKEMESRNVLWKNRKTIIRKAQPEGIGHISSTVVREKMFSEESLQGYLHPAAEELLRNVNIKDFPEEICKFQDDYEFLNNRYPAPFKWRNRMFGTADAAFKAAQNTLETKQELLDTMEEIVRCKFEQHPELMQKLLDTDGKVLIAGSNGKEVFWGVNLYAWKGENYLGKILMKIREEKQSEIQYRNNSKQI
jgi:predicted NAD-dependent protein-ADP-ribosyltransferase YbiA (DUF1768 family)